MSKTFNIFQRSSLYIDLSKTAEERKEDPFGEGQKEPEKGHEAEVAWRVSTTAGPWMPPETRAWGVLRRFLWSIRTRLHPLDKPRQQDSLLKALGNLHPAKLHQTLLQASPPRCSPRAKWGSEAA